MMTLTLQGIEHAIAMSALALALLTLAVSLGGLLWPNSSRSRSFRAAEGFLLLLLTAALLVVAEKHLSKWVDDAAYRFCLLLGLVAAAVIAFHAAMSRRASGGLAHFPLGIVAGLLTACLSVHYLTLASDPLPLPDMAPGELVEVQGVQGYTDAGSPVQLFTLIGSRQAPGDSPLQWQSPLDRQPFGGRVIQVGPAEPEGHCHGWTFCGGRYMLTFQTVEQIVRENGYRRVQQPFEGDLILYHRGKRPGAMIVHSGVVKAVGKDGFVLVESKWAHRERYLHAPELQPYSPDYAYFRSDREGHLLLGLPPLSAYPPPSPSAVSPPPAGAAAE